MEKNDTNNDVPQAARPVETPSAQKTMSRRKIAALIIVLMVVFAAALAYDRTHQNNNALTQLTKPAVDGNQARTAIEESVTGVADKVSPSVVSIVTNVTQQTYFGTYSSEGAGTGIIVSSDGYILTNRHVVSDVKSVKVITTDGTTYENVDVLGVDPLNDVAFLKIKDANGLVAATLGDSSTVRGRNR